MNGLAIGQETKGTADSCWTIDLETQGTDPMDSGWAIDMETQGTVTMDTSWTIDLETQGTDPVDSGWAIDPETINYVAIWHYPGKDLILLAWESFEVLKISALDLVNTRNVPDYLCRIMSYYSISGFDVIK